MPIPGDAVALRLYAALLAAPGDEALAALREATCEAAWLRPALAELETLPLDAWQAEHTRLFVSGHPTTPCPPFASAYREGRMEGDASAAARAFYARLGLAATALPADFLGTLLECAAWLAETPGKEALREELLRDHLAPWVGRFARDVNRHAALFLYRALGERLAALFPVRDGD